MIEICGGGDDNLGNKYQLNENNKLMKTTKQQQGCKAMLLSSDVMFGKVM